MTKTYGGRVVIDGLDLKVPTGSIFALAGPNGSGKTTTIRLLLGLVRATGGWVRLFGREMPGAAQHVLPSVGAIVDRPGFYPFLSGRDNLARFDRIGRRRKGEEPNVDFDQVLASVGLSHFADKPYRTYTPGMRQRLAFAHAIARPRRLLVLDEPTTGLDPQAAAEIRSLISVLHERGATVLISTHTPAEVQGLCTHAAVLRAGRVVAQGTIDDIRGSGRSFLRVETADVRLAHEVLLRTPGTANVIAEQTSDGGFVELELHDLAPEQVASALVHADVRVSAMFTTRPSFDERFEAFTGKDFDVAE